MKTNIEHTILLMVDRLTRANIPYENLCYECTPAEWNELKSVIGKSLFKDEYRLDDMHNVRYSGLHIREKE